ncbi:MAG: hypothetical protein WCV85_04235 [Patescibacteria group bacterium]|jgi:hypothetical protein
MSTVFSLTFSFVVGFLAIIILRLYSVSNLSQKIIGTTALLIGIVLDLTTNKGTGISVVEILQTFFASAGLAILLGLLFEWWGKRLHQDQTRA